MELLLKNRKDIFTFPLQHTCTIELPTFGPVYMSQEPLRRSNTKLIRELFRIPFLRCDPGELGDSGVARSTVMTLILSHR